ncbi:hypothetical protein HanIR_Chr10g0493691 [Helianthus annuus]|nr:hypothetical protein HanIR_Chr10g0493691 [Helianthus annuus]
MADRTAVNLVGTADWCILSPIDSHLVERKLGTCVVKSENADAVIVKSLLFGYVSS